MDRESNGRQGVWYFGWAKKLREAKGSNEKKRETAQREESHWRPKESNLSF
jgi:hypothetical protein